MRQAELISSERLRVVAAAQRAAAGSAWYAQQLAECGFTSQPDFDHVPVLTERDMAGYYSSEQERAHAGELYLTSGTTSGSGRPVRWPQGDHRAYVAQRTALFRSLLDASNQSACADLGTGHAQASALEIFDSLGLDGYQIDISNPIEQHVEILGRLQPDFIYTMPVILERIVGAGGPGYVPSLVAVLGDMAPRPWRRAMERRLGMESGRVVDAFGSIEVGAIAYSDDEHSRYLFHEQIIPEAMPTGEPAADGQRLVLTSTARDGFPAVRYAAGDIVSGLRPVTVAGVRRWAFESHLGREGWMIKHGEALNVALMTECIASVAPGIAWSVRRAGLECVIEVDERAWTAQISEAIAGAIRAAHPAVDAMIKSGLVGDLRVAPRAFPAGTGKRSIR